jgi:O-methyltransferase
MNINAILKTTPIISNMVTPSQIKHILNNLNTVLKENIQGDVIELGCNVGTTSIFIRQLLDKHKSTKNFSVYDSFEGLPPKLLEDETSLERQYKEGSCKTSLETFIGNFKEHDLKEPDINVGWFKEIKDECYPDKVAFAFFDGDFYSSIIDSFDKVYHRLSPGARIIIHDFGWDALPGVEKACTDFLKDKPEKMELLEVGIGLLVKK